MWAPHPTLSRTSRPRLSNRYFPSRQQNLRPMAKRRRPPRIPWGRGNCLWILWISHKSSKQHSRQDPTPSIGWCLPRLPQVSSRIRIPAEGTWATSWIWIIIRVLPRPLRSRGHAETLKGFSITWTRAESRMKKHPLCRVASPCRSILWTLPQLTRTPNSLPTTLLKRWLTIGQPIMASEVSQGRSAIDDLKMIKPILPMWIWYSGPLRKIQTLWTLWAPISLKRRRPLPRSKPKRIRNPYSWIATSWRVEFFYEPRCHRPWCQMTSP